MKRKKTVRRSSTREQLTKLNARVWFLEQIERREAAYRRALAVVRRREAQLKVARTELDKAAAAFLDPYAPSELTFTHQPAVGAVSSQEPSNP